MDAPVGTSNVGTGVENGKEGGARGRHAAQQHPQVSGTRETEEEGRSPVGKRPVYSAKGFKLCSFSWNAHVFPPHLPIHPSAINP